MHIPLERKMTMNQTNFAQSETARNLMRAFAGESQARNRYTIAAYTASESKQYLLSELFRFTANQEKEHAVILWNMLAALSGQNIQIEGGYPVETSNDLQVLLQSAVHNEEEEAKIVYPEFAKTAAEEGYLQQADLFTHLAAIERTHSDRFKRFADLLSQSKLFSGGVQGWLCLNCGYIHEGESAPQTCPVCSHPQGYFIRSDLSPLRG